MRDIQGLDIALELKQLPFCDWFKKIEFCFATQQQFESQSSWSLKIQ